MKSGLIVDLGLVEYGAAWELQRRLVAAHQGIDGRVGDEDQAAGDRDVKVLDEALVFSQHGASKRRWYNSTKDRVMASTE